MERTLRPPCMPAGSTKIEIYFPIVQRKVLTPNDSSRAQVQQVLKNGLWQEEESLRGKSRSERSRPSRQRLEPLNGGRRENAGKLVAIFCRVVEKQSVIRSPHGYRKVFEAAPVASAHIDLRNIMAANEDAILDPGEINFDVFPFRCKPTRSRSPELGLDSSSRGSSFRQESSRS